jgi:hypothetical protein
MSGKLEITKALLDKIVNVHAKSTEMFDDIEEQNKHNKEEDLTERRNKALNNAGLSATSTSSGSKMKK